ncbi:MAG: glycosyltransferase family 2 protein [Clostridia bacterium]|nr:glycosyltransferase family 2 protein [Clostridia bacterium]
MPSEIPAISIIIPIYNTESRLNTCLEPLLARSFPTREVILVDDGSTDESGRICDAYARTDPRVRVIHQENRGVSAARNQGIRAARGSYICFVDSDDTVDPAMPEEQYRAMTERDVDCVVSGLTYDFPETGDSKAYPVTEGYIRIPEDLNQRYRELADRRILNSHCGKLYKKELIDRHGIAMNEACPVLEDGLFVLDYLAVCTSVYCLPTAPYHYRQTSAPTLQKRYHPAALGAWMQYAQAYRRLTEHLDGENTLHVYGRLWSRYRAFLTDVYVGSGLSSHEKFRLLKEFTAGIHELEFFGDLPQCPERGAKKRLIFFLVKHKLTYPLHGLLKLRYG